MVKHRILLADDSVTIQKVVNLTFADEGIEVVAVGDGDAAMQKFVEAVPDLVMVDVNMPGADGYRICEMIKEDDETKHIPVILLVGSFEPFDEEEARRVGADDFLTKPFQSIRQLVNKVTDLLNGKRNASFGDEKAVSSFDDTLEMVKPVEEPERKTNFGDAAMDDEMIQTNQIGSLPVNEVQKFEFVPKTEDAKENQISENEVSVEESITETDSIENQETETVSGIIENEADSEIEEIEKIEDDENFEDEKSATDSNEIPVEENLTKEILPEETQEKVELFPNESQDEIEDTADGSETDEDDDEPMPRHENIYEFANEQELEAEETDESLAETKEIVIVPLEETEQEQSESETSEDEIETDAPKEENFQERIETEETEPVNLIEETAPIQTEESEETPSKFETTQEFALDDFDLLELPQSRKAKSSAAKIAEMPTAKGNLSPEDIEAVADRVVEKLSRETIEQIVREVLSQTSKK